MTMTATYSTDAKDTIRQFVRRSIRGAAFEDDTDLFESGIVNSLFAVQLMTFIEKEFRIEVGMEDLDIEHFNLPADEDVIDAIDRIATEKRA